MERRKGKKKIKLPSLEALEKLPKDLREIIFLELPYEKIKFLCERSSVLRQSWSSREFWRRKLIHDGYILYKDFDEWTINWKPKEMDITEFLRYFYDDFHSSVIGEYDIDSYLKVNRLISYLIEEMKMPGFFDTKKYLDSLRKVDLTAQTGVVKWTNFTQDIYFQEKIVRERIKRRAKTGFSNIYVYTGLISHENGKNGKRYLPMLDDPKFEFDIDDFSTELRDNDDEDPKFEESLFNDDLNQKKGDYIGIITRRLRIFKDMIQEGDIISFEDHSRVIYSYVYLIDGNPYLKQLEMIKEKTYLPIEALPLLKELKPQSLEQLSRISPIWVNGFVLSEKSYIEMGDSKEKKNLLDWRASFSRKNITAN